MKTPTSSTVNNLLNRFDKELRKLLLSDLSTRGQKTNLADAVHDKLNHSLKAA